MQAARSLGRKRQGENSIVGRTPSAIPHCNNSSAPHNEQAHKLGEPQKDATLQKRKKMGRSPNGKRPKSREETPKEGNGSAKRYRTAIYDRFNPKCKGC
jgi:hypothetical protein